MKQKIAASPAHDRWSCRALVSWRNRHFDNVHQRTQESEQVMACFCRRTDGNPEGVHPGAAQKSKDPSEDMMIKSDSTGDPHVRL